MKDLKKSLTTLPSPTVPLPFSLDPSYFHKDYFNMTFAELLEEEIIQRLGEGDFCYYNLMVLFVLQPLSSIEMKICIGIVCMIYIQMGYILTIVIVPFVEVKYAKWKPALPFPILAFSAYFVLINTFVEDSNSDLCKYFNYSIITDSQNNINKNDLIDFLL